MSYKPNVYSLGARPEIRIAVVDDAGAVVQPTEARLSIQDASGTITTVSGADMTWTDSTYYAYTYYPTASGFYSYEAWAKDSSGREVADSNSFHVYDRVT